jgi:LacI family transcriptional regulator
MSKLSQREFAARLGLSYKTVSRVLNGSDCVNEITRRRVLDEAERLGFCGHAMARGLRLKKSFAIGLAMRNGGQTFWLDVAEAMDQRARETGYHLVISHRRRDCNSTEEIRFLRDRQVDALIVAPHPTKEDRLFLRDVAEAGIPILMLVQQVPGFLTHYLGTDSRTGTREACTYLLGLGHREIAYVIGPPEDTAVTNRLQGYREAMRAAGIPDPHQVVVRGGWRRDGGEAAAQALLALPRLPTAIMAVADLTAFGIYLALRRAGVRIPEDVSLVGYGNESAGELLATPLTTVAQPAEELGRRAIELVLEILDGRHPDPVVAELSDRLLVRDSCAPPRRDSP